MNYPVSELCVGMSSFYAFPLVFFLYITPSHFSPPPLFFDLLPNTPSLSLLYLPASSSPPSSLSSCHSVFWLYYYPSLYSHDTQWILYSVMCERRTVRGSEWRILVLINWSPPMLKIHTEWVKLDVCLLLFSQSQLWKILHSEYKVLFKKKWQSSTSY